MKTVTTKAIAKVAAVATGLAMATSMLSLAPMAHAAALTSAQVQSILGLLTSFGADAATIANVNASLTGGTPTATTPSTSGSCSFTRDLTSGSTGADVTALQKWLITKGYSLPAGATGYFGAQTKAAVIKWQTATGLSPAAGYFGAKSRASAGCNAGSTSSTGTTPTVPVGTGTGLKVMLSPTSPNGSVLVQGQGIGDLADFTFANPTGSPISVTGLTFNRVGVSNDATLANVYLYNGVNRITDSAGISASQFSYANAAGIFTVPAGGTYTVSVRADILTGTSGQQVGVKLISVNTNATLDGSVVFPVMGGYQTISAATLATVDLSNSASTLPTTNASLSPTSDFVVWQNSISVSTNPVKFTSMKLTNLGSIDSVNLQNLRLYVDGTMVGSAVAQLGADRTVTFDLSASPLSLSTASHTVKVLANVVGGSNRTFQFSVQYSSDVQFVDSQLNQPVTPTVAGASFSAVSSGVQTVAAVSGATGISVSRAAASPSDNVPTGVSNVKLASFNILVTGEAVKVKDLYVYANTSVHAGGLANGKVYVNGAQIGSTKTIGEGSSAAVDFSLGSSLIIPAGTVTVVDVYADTKTSTSTNLSNTETVRVSLKAASSNAQGVSSLNAANVPDTTDVNGNTITVSSSSLTATTYSGYANQTMIAGTVGAKLGSFTLSAGSVEGVNVNTIAFDLAGNTGVQNVMLKNDATGAQIGNTITTPAATGNSFPVSLAIPQSGTVTIDIYGDVLSSYTSGTIQATLTTSTTGTGAITNTNSPLAGTKALQTITVGSGLLTMSVGAANPVNSNVIMGASAVGVGSFTFTSQNSPFTVKKLEFAIPNGVATSTSGLTLTYKDVNGATQQATQSVLVSTSASSTVAFDGLSLYVPANGTANVNVSTGISSFTNSVSGAAVTVGLYHATGFLATDATNNATTSIGTADVMSATSGYGTMYVRKSIPTFAGQANAANANAEPVGSDIYKFTVTADAAGDIDLDQIALKVSTSTVTVTGYTLYDSTSGSPIALNASAVTGTNSSGIVKIKPDSVIQVGAGQTKTFTVRASTFTGTWNAGAGLHVSLAPADSVVANAAAASLEAGNNYVWSDRSAAGHSTSTSDWTGGFLLKNLNDGTYNFAY